MSSQNIGKIINNKPLAVKIKIRLKCYIVYILSGFHQFRKKVPSGEKESLYEIDCSFIV